MATTCTDNTALIAVDLYRQLCGRNGNLFFSPYSLSVALGMTYAGACSATEAEIASGLHFTLSQKNLHPAFQTLRQIIGEAQGERVLLREANALWPHVDYRFWDEFINTLQTYYGASLTKLDYRDPEKARQVINAWVAEKTADHIRDLITAGILNSLTRLVLSNAIYFKGDWAQPFEKEQTTPEPFWMTPERDVYLPTMHRTATFGYAKTAQAHILELPYYFDKMSIYTETLSMFILLPLEQDGLAALEAGLDAKRLLPRRLPQTEVVLSLPKFKLECKFRLNDVLRSLGIKDAFDPQKADFSGIRPTS